jgi:aspartate aminotransferase-like enzyme
MYALRQSLFELASEGLENVWKRHACATDRLYEKLKVSGLVNFVPEPKDRLVGTILFHPPKGITPDNIMMRMRNR